MALMRDYVRRLTNFTTKPSKILRICTLCAWVFFSTVLPCEFIYVKPRNFQYILKTRLAGEIYSSDVNMRKGYSIEAAVSKLFR